MNNRKRGMLRSARENKSLSGYYIVKHMKWLWELNSYPDQMKESSFLVKELLRLGYLFTPDEMAIIFRAVRKGNHEYFSYFEQGMYVPTPRDIEKVSGMLQLQADLYAKRTQNVLSYPAINRVSRVGWKK